MSFRFRAADGPRNCARKGNALVRRARGDCLSNGVAMERMPDDFLRRSKAPESPETAACLLAILCREGAVFTIDAGRTLNVDFSAVAFPVGDCDPQDIAVMIRDVLEANQRHLAVGRSEALSRGLSCSKGRTVAAQLHVLDVAVSLWPAHAPATCDKAGEAKAEQ